jgi:glucan phosphoethanolaminetransferase (alkaline phosphatase superfamily)
LTHPFNISNSYLASHTFTIPSIFELTINLMKTKIQWITNLSKLLSCLFLLLLECVFMFFYFYVIVVRRDTSFDWEKSRILQIPKRQVSHTVMSYYFSMHFVVIFSSYPCVGLF